LDTFSNQIELRDATDSKRAWHEGSFDGLCYRVDGAGARRLALIHELGGSMASWDAVTRRLAADAHVMRYDQRGQGRSALAQTPYSLHDQVADLHALLDAMGANEPLWLVAAAAGATIAVSFAANHRERVKGLVLCGPALDIDPARRHYLLERAQSARQQGMQSIVDVTLANSWPAPLRIDTHAFDTYRDRFLAQDANGYAHASEALSEIELSSALASLDCPCLFLAGESDLQRPPHRVAMQAKRVAGASFAVVPWAGHLMAVQQPDEVAARIEEFIAENEG
jgi:3-oxoadipate enol-lactonase